MSDVASPGRLLQAKVRRDDPKSAVQSWLTAWQRPGGSALLFHTCLREKKKKKKNPQKKGPKREQEKNWML